MKCYLHTSTDAVGLCPECSTGICSQCTRRFKRPACIPCAIKKNKQVIATHLGKLILSAAIFIACVFYLHPDWSHTAAGARAIKNGIIWWWAYMWMSIPLGIILCGEVWTKIFGPKKEKVEVVYFGNDGATAIYGLFGIAFGIARIMIVLMVGLFTAPLILLYSVYRLIRLTETNVILSKALAQGDPQVTPPQPPQYQQNWTIPLSPQSTPSWPASQPQFTAQWNQQPVQPTQPQFIPQWSQQSSQFIQPQPAQHWNQQPVQPTQPQSTQHWGQQSTQPQQDRGQWNTQPIQDWGQSQRP